MAQGKLKLQIRTDIFEHCIYPCPSRLNSSSIINLIKSLYLVAGQDGKVQFSQWAEVAIKQLSLSLQEAEVYYETFRNLAYENKPNSIDAKLFALFLCLQLYTAATTRISLENASSLSSKFNSEYPGFTGSGTFPNPQASPRSKAVRGFLFTQPASDFQMAHQFVKGNLKLLLKVVSGDPQAQEVALSPDDFNALSLVIEGAKPLSRACPMFSSALKVHYEELVDWLNRKLNCPSTESLSGMENILVLSDLKGSVIIKESQECVEKDVFITTCEESYIYLNANVKQVSIVNCREVTIFIGAVRKIASIDKCELCSIVLCSNMVRVGNSVDCTLHTYSPFPPVLYGDNRGLTLGPYSACYPRLASIVESANIPRSSTNQKVLHSWATPIQMNTEGLSYSLLQPKDFFPIVLPNSLSPQNPNPAFTPEEFVNAIAIREDYFRSIQAMIANSNLTEEQERRLHLAIQGHFREWLSSSGQYKAPLELVRMMDQE